MGDQLCLATRDACCRSSLDSDICDGSWRRRNRRVSSPQSSEFALAWLQWLAGARVGLDPGGTGPSLGVCLEADSKPTLGRHASAGHRQTARNHLYRFPSLALRADEIRPGVVLKLRLGNCLGNLVLVVGRRSSSDRRCNRLVELSTRATASAQIRKMQEELREDFSWLGK